MPVTLGSSRLLRSGRLHGRRVGIVSNPASADRSLRVLGSLTEVPLFGSAAVLTAFNDNALITYLATLVPDLSDSLRYAVVAGAVPVGVDTRLGGGHSKGSLSTLGGQA